MGAPDVVLVLPLVRAYCGAPSAPSALATMPLSSSNAGNVGLPKSGFNAGVNSVTSWYRAMLAPLPTAVQGVNPASAVVKVSIGTSAGSRTERSQTAAQITSLRDRACAHHIHGLLITPLVRATLDKSTERGQIY